MTAAQASLQQDTARPSMSLALLGLREGSHTVTERWLSTSIQHSAAVSTRMSEKPALGNYRRLSLVLTGQTDGPSPSLSPQTHQFSHAMATLPHPGESHRQMAVTLPSGVLWDKGTGQGLWVDPRQMHTFAVLSVVVGATEAKLGGGE